MLGGRRRQAFCLLTGSGVEAAVARDIESVCHAASGTAIDYDDRIVRAAHNLSKRPSLGVAVVHLSDEECARGTAVGRVQDELRLRRERFEGMLQEKYEALDDQKFQAIVRCRRCGSEEIVWEEKQTRSADEGATIFAACVKCKNRWVMS